MLCQGTNHCPRQAEFTCADCGLELCADHGDKWTQCGPWGGGMHRRSKSEPKRRPTPAPDFVTHSTIWGLKRSEAKELRRMRAAVRSRAGMSAPRERARRARRVTPQVPRPLRVNAERMAALAERDARIEARYSEGASCEAIGLEFSLSARGVRYVLRGRGVVLRTRRGPAAETVARGERFAVEYNADASLDAIATRHGVGVTTVRRSLLAVGCQLRSPGGRRTA